MTNGAAPPFTLPPEAMQALAAVFAMLQGRPGADPSEAAREGTRTASARLATALPFAVLLWVHSLYKTGKLEELARGLREESRANGVSAEDADAAMLLGFSALIAKHLQDSLSRDFLNQAS